MIKVEIDVVRGQGAKIQDSVFCGEARTILWDGNRNNKVLYLVATSQNCLVCRCRPLDLQTLFDSRPTMYNKSLCELLSFT